MSRLHVTANAIRGNSTFATSQNAAPATTSRKATSQSAAPATKKQRACIDTLPKYCACHAKHENDLTFCDLGAPKRAFRARLPPLFILWKTGWCRSANVPPNGSELTSWRRVGDDDATTTEQNNANTGPTPDPDYKREPFATHSGKKGSDSGQAAVSDSSAVQEYHSQRRHKHRHALVIELPVPMWWAPGQILPWPADSFRSMKHVQSIPVKAKTDLQISIFHESCHCRNTNSSNSWALCFPQTLLGLGSRNASKSDCRICKITSTIRPHCYSKIFQPLVVLKKASRHCLGSDA